MLTVPELPAGPFTWRVAWWEPPEFPNSWMVPVLLRAAAVTVVAALRPVLPILTVLLLVRVPPTFRVLPPSPKKMSALMVPLLLRPVVVVTVVPLSMVNVPALDASVARALLFAELPVMRTWVLAPSRRSEPVLSILVRAPEPNSSRASPCRLTAPVTWPAVPKPAAPATLSVAWVALLVLPVRLMVPVLLRAAAVTVVAELRPVLPILTVLLLLRVPPMLRPVVVVTVVPLSMVNVPALDASVARALLFAELPVMRTWVLAPSRRSEPVLSILVRAPEPNSSRASPCRLTVPVTWPAVPKPAAPATLSVAWVALLVLPVRLMVPGLLRAAAVTVVAELKPVLPISTVLLLVRVPPTFRVLPPCPPKRSTSRLPLLLLKSVVVVSVAPFERLTVPPLLVTPPVKLAEAGLPTRSHALLVIVTLPMVIAEVSCGAPPFEIVTS